MFLHAIGAVGHDVVKYALDTYAIDVTSPWGASLSCTHDANAWPSDRYAGLPAPREDERVILWLQNSHATPIPAGAVALDRMGAERPAGLMQEVGPFATVAVDVAEVLPGLRWPAQIELLAGRHMMRPRYEVTRGGRVRIAHVNVERSDLKPEPAIARLHKSLGRGYLLPFPVLPRERFRSIVQPTPMAVSQKTLPLRLDVFDAAGNKVAAGSSVAWRVITTWRWKWMTPRQDTQSWSMTFAMAVRRMAGCMRCSATRTGNPDTPRNPASAGTFSTRS